MARISNKRRARLKLRKKVQNMTKNNLNKRDRMMASLIGRMQSESLMDRLVRKFNPVEEELIDSKKDNLLGQDVS